MIGLLERLGHLSLILEDEDGAANYYYEILKRDIANPLAYEQLMSIFEHKDRYKYYIYRGNKNSLEELLIIFMLSSWIMFLFKQK